MKIAKITFDIPMDRLGALQEFVMGIQMEATKEKVSAASKGPENVPAPKAVLAEVDTGTGTVTGATPEEMALEAAEEKKKVDMTMLRDLAINQTKNDPKRLAAALEQFGAKKLSQVKEDDYEALYSELGGEL